MFAEGHPGEQRRRVGAKRRYQYDQHDTAAMLHQPQPHQAAEGQGNGDTCRQNGAHVPECQRPGRPVFHHHAGKQQDQPCRQQPRHQRRCTGFADTAQICLQDHRYAHDTAQAPPAAGDLPAGDRRQQLVGAHGAQGAQQYRRGPVRRDDQHKQQQRDSHHRH